MTLIVRLAGSFAALVTALALLLADSADPDCEVVPFDRTYRVTSSCAEFGDETIRVVLDEGPDETRWIAEITHVDGDATVTEVELQGYCQDEGDPVDLQWLNWTLTEIGAPAGAATLRCNTLIDGSEPFCESLDPDVDPSCTITVEPVDGD